MFRSTERAELSTLWDDLVAGTAKVKDWSHSGDSWSVVVTRATPAPETNSASRPPRARDLEILERALLSGVRKRIALEVKLSCSSIAVIMQGCFQYMGVSCVPSRIPGMLVLACQAHQRQGRTRYPRLIAGRDHREQTVTVPRPDRVLFDWLAPAEFAVIRLLVEGQSYAEIADARQTSIRTVANQVASGFRRLGVSGRAELLCLVARWAFDPPVPPVKRPSLIVLPHTRTTASTEARPLRGARLAAACLSPNTAT
jgi:DNA-binding CsgD family transcriptional regulator